MSITKNLIGQVFGKLTVVAPDTTRKRKRWKCVCTCGQVTIVATDHLNSGHTSSCGCLKGKPFGSFRSQPGSVGLKLLYNSYRIGAERRELSFKLSLDEFKSITSTNCYYCGSAPNKIIYPKQKCMNEQRKNFNTYIFNGIDRQDNKQGYELNNVVPCCSFCNYAKRDRSTEEFMIWIKALVNHQLCRISQVLPEKPKP